MINLVQYDESKYPWSRIYFHGLCEDFVGAISGAVGDLVGSIETKTPRLGIYDVYVYGKLAQAYVWENDISHRKGLIVFPEDKESVAMAIAMFVQNEK